MTIMVTSQCHGGTVILLPALLSGHIRALLTRDTLALLLRHLVTHLPVHGPTLLLWHLLALGAGDLPTHVALHRLTHLTRP